MKRIGLVEVGLFSSSLLLLGLVIWFFSLTFFGSSNDSQAQISSWAMSSAMVSKVSEAAQLPKAKIFSQEEQGLASQNSNDSSSHLEQPLDSSNKESSFSSGAALPARNNDNSSSAKVSSIQDPPGFNDNASWVPPRPGNDAVEEPQIELASVKEGEGKFSEVNNQASEKLMASKVAIDKTVNDPAPVPLDKGIKDSQSLVEPASAPQENIGAAKSVVAPVKTIEKSSTKEVGPGSSLVAERGQKETGAATVVVYEPSTTRDPMMTPEESRRIIEQRKSLEEQERRLAQEESARRKANDPFEMAKRKIKIQGVLHTDDGMSVIINNQILQPGDSYAGSKVVQISEHKVTFRFDGKTFSKVVPQD